MRLLHCFAGILVVLALCRGAEAALMHDDFSSDTSGNYTPIAGLAQTNSRLPDLSVVGGELRVTTNDTGHGSSATQTYILHNTATLGVGETLLLDVSLRTTTTPAYDPFGGNSSETIGITVTESGFTGVPAVPSASGTSDFRSDKANIYAGFRELLGRDRFLTDAFGEMPGYELGQEYPDQGISNSDTDPNLDTITSVFIARLDTNDYAMGWIENGTTPHVVRTMTAHLGANPSVGIYSDTRNASFNHLVDNFRIVAQVPEPSAMVLSTLGIAAVGLLARKRRT